jgi:serine/threonine protein kinase
VAFDEANAVKHILESEVEIGTKLGQGNFGEVFKYWNYFREFSYSYRGLWHSSPVALKKLRDGVSQEEVVKFWREIRILQKLQHPNIVQ